MRIHFRTEGGLAYLPGLSKTVTIDCDQLPEEEATSLERLVQAARFFDLPARIDPPRPGAADYRRYTVTVEGWGRRHTVSTVDPVENPELQALLDNLRSKAQRGRSAT